MKRKSFEIIYKITKKGITNEKKDGKVHKKAVDDKKINMLLFEWKRYQLKIYININKGEVR
ncbi:MAG: hypothetical protein IIV45_14475 [Lachnospiraceae bacterium]|nr:hypothetical protein [Lachnospiraceae bacterium]